MEVRVLNYGGIITDIFVPDRNGKLENVVLGFESLENYRHNNDPYFGALIGRYANRIGKATFQMGGKRYQLFANNNGNTLHGGRKGFDKVVWNVKQVSDSILILTYFSLDGEEGFPGNLWIEVMLSLDEYNTLTFNYKATTDQATYVSFTSHSYFNLTAGKSPTITNHEIKILAEKITEVDKEGIPTGQLLEVTDSPFNFLKMKTIGTDLGRVPGGYDHNYVLVKTNGNEQGKAELAAEVCDPLTGRVMRLYTTEPGLQFYSGNFLDGSIKGKDGQAYVKHSGFCLEPQHFPDSPNQPHFPNTILQPGETYLQTSVLEFSVR